MIKRNIRNILAWASVCLNVVLIAVIVIGPHRLLPHPPGPPSPDKMLSHIGEDLSGQDKVIFNQILEKHKADLQRAHENMRPTFDNISRVAKQDPLDMDAVQKAHDALYENRGKIDRSIEGFILEMLPLLSNEGRKALKLAPPPKK